MFLILRAMRSLALTLLLPLLLLGGCATTNPRDPLEPMNRAIYSFNDGVDTALIRPIAEGYKAVLPSFVRTGISNFFANINDVLIALNNLLQGKIVNAVSDLGRVLVNTTVGVAGVFDMATEFGLEKHNEDFGQTLGYWGIGDGPYLVLPLLGPSNLRDAIGRVVDVKTDPLTYTRSMSLRNSLWGLRFLNQRAELLDTSRILDTAALDPYEFLRDAYLQRRRNLVHDGAPPREKDDAAELQYKPQASRPNPGAAEGNATKTPARITTLTTMGADDLTPARAAAQEAAEAAVAASAAVQRPIQVATPEIAKAAAPAAAPQTEVTLPTEPTGAGASATEPQNAAVRMVRVWAPAAD